MKFPPALLDEIRARLPLSQVIGRHVQWDRRRSRPSRGDWWACCPFHAEKTPSFHADDRRGRYYCFGCHAKGDVFTFLVEKEGLGFAEAVERLAAEAGVSLPAPDPEAARREEERTTILDVLERAARFFEARLRAPEGAAARTYVTAERDLDEETIAAFRLGYAPDARDALYAHLQQGGVSRELIERAGLIAVPDDGGSPYDRFRNRLIFPIRDVRGRVIAFGGRALGPARAKYLNSPETELFHKSHVLYNLDRARGPAFERGEIIVVEGYMDVIALHRAGLPHAVAPLGTALTESHLAMLWRISPVPLLCLDGDAAGMQAAWRTLETALPHLRPGHSLRIAFLPGGMDPDDLLRERGPEALNEALAAASPLIEVLWRHVVESSPLRTPEERARLEQRFDELTATIGDARVRAHYRDEIRARLRRLWGGAAPRGRGRGSLPAFRRRRNALPPARAAGRVSATPATQVSGRLRALATTAGESFHEREVLRIVLLQPEILEHVSEDFAALPLSSPVLDSLRRKILDIAAGHVELDSARLLTHLQEQGMGERARRLIGGGSRPSRRRNMPDLDLRHLLASFAEHVVALRRTAVLKRELQAAEKAFGEDPSEENLARIHRIREELQAAGRLAGE